MAGIWSLPTILSLVASLSQKARVISDPVPMEAPSAVCRSAAAAAAAATVCCASSAMQ